MAPLDGPIFEHGSSATLSRYKRLGKEDSARRTCAAGVVSRFLSIRSRFWSRASQILFFGFFQAIPATRVNSADNLRRLRELMRNEKIDAYIVPRSDEHYVSCIFKLPKFLLLEIMKTGFQDSYNEFFDPGCSLLTLENKHAVEISCGECYWL